MVVHDERQEPGPARIFVLDTPQHVAEQAALEFQVRAKGAIEQFGRFTVALSGGSTPKAMMALLATPLHAERIDWRNVHVFWGDERCVPPDNKESNYLLAYSTLLAHVPVTAEQIHRMQGELEPSAAAQAYDEELQTFFQGPPRFDLTFLGLGDDGHTASLFPGSKALDTRDRWCVENYAGDRAASPWRLTLTYPAINASRSVMFLVEGSKKAGIVARVLEGDRDPHQLPAQGVSNDGSLTWLLDRDAGAKLKHTSRPYE